MTQLVGIGGLLASGKDTVSDYLVEKYGWVKIGMSDALGDALYTLNPYVNVETYISKAPMRAVSFAPGVYRYQNIVDVLGYTDAKTIPEVRRLLQVLGTEVGRNMIDENVWTDISRRRIQALRAEGKNVILTGIRFDNEANMIREEGGELWWVDRGTVKGTKQTSAHASENSLSAKDFDRKIANKGSLEDIYRAVDGVVG